MAATLVVGPKIGPFTEAYPDVVLDITTTADRVDLVAGGFDAGIQLGEYVERDMVAVRVSRDQRAAIAGSPRYFEAHSRPASPRELPEHRCISFKRGSSGPYRWEFEKHGQALSVAVGGSVVVDTVDLLIRSALDGAGLIFGFEEHVASHLASGALVRVLDDWCPPFPGYFLYYPSRRQQPAALSALIQAFRL
jgi:DNA-binding transcriptional LysR family regulator